MVQALRYDILFERVREDMLANFDLEYSWSFVFLGTTSVAFLRFLPLISLL